MISGESDFDAFRDDFVVYLAAKLGVSRDAALSSVGRDSRCLRCGEAVGGVGVQRC